MALSSLSVGTATGGGSFATDLIGGTHWPFGKLAHGGAGTATPWSVDDPGPVRVYGGTLDALTGTVTVTHGAGSVLVHDGGQSLTVDGAVSVSGTAVVTAASIPAAAQATDSIRATRVMDYIMRGTVGLTPQHAPFTLTTSGGTLIAAAGAGSATCIHAAFLMANTDVTVALTNGSAAGSHIVPPVFPGTRAGFVLSPVEWGWGTTAANTAVIGSLSGGTVSGVLIYTTYGTA